MPQHPIRLRGKFATGEVWLNDKPLPLAPSLKLWNHSPTGFMWGYAGSGPAQLALAVLLEATGNAQWAVENHQRFKFDFIAKIPQVDFEISIDLQQWGKNHEER